MKNIALAIGAVIVSAGMARADILVIGPFDIDGAQEVPPVATPATGTGTVTLDTMTNEISWNISWSGLSGAATAMHFHGNANPGANAGVQVNIGFISGLASPSVGSTTISGAQATDLLAGLWYVNIHTSLNPGGEIRGQIIPTPGAFALLGLGGLAACRRRR